MTRGGARSEASRPPAPRALAHAPIQGLAASDAQERANSYETALHALQRLNHTGRLISKFVPPAQGRRLAQRLRSTEIYVGVGGPRRSQTAVLHTTGAVAGGIVVSQ